MAGEWASYIAAWRERRRQADKELGQHTEMGRAAARACARVLVERYGARRVWLFGSLVQRRFVHAGSDIDLAVEGLPPEAYFRALAAVWRLLPPDFNLDLVPLEDAKPSLVDHVREEGELLFERP